MCIYSIWWITGITPSQLSHVCLSVDSFFCLSICLYICLHVCLFVCTSICLYICLFIYPSLRLSACLSLCLSLCLSICLSVCLNIEISAVIRAKVFKLGMKVYANSEQTKIFSNTGCHTHRFRKSYTKFFNSICKRHLKGITFELKPILSWS